ncbi:MAG TPA: UbiA family prenyltransferase [Chryseosolibacter sp.]|nr:UbiA family prenyltransferase [Chryseosolibacter sp.]
MFSRSSLLHLRIPFSFFLLPIYFFALCISPNFNEPRILWVFVIIHLLLYPASNGYNSYFDKDEKSIGGLKNPPPTKKGLYFLALALDVLAIVLGYIFLNLTFAIMLFVYGLVSKAYSHPSIRLKKYPYLSLAITGIFQGIFTFVMCYIGLNNFEFAQALKWQVLLPGFLTSMMLWANYPMTQIYQHEEDKKRGDQTLSLTLGIKGTFAFTTVVFGIAVVLFLLYFYYNYNAVIAWSFLIAIVPILVYFFYWFYLVMNDRKNADYSHTMLLNIISGICLNSFFIFIFLRISQVLQLFS